MLYRFLLLIFFGLFASSVQAGTLFPPENAPSGSLACANGEVLTWTGDGTKCSDPTKGVSLQCPAGQYLTGISRGVPVCAAASSYTAGGYMWAGAGYCRILNPLTGGCTCSAGYHPALSWEFTNSGCNHDFYRDGGRNPGCAVAMYTCYRD